MDRPRSFGPALILIGLVALLRAACSGVGLVAPERVGAPIDLRLQALSGNDFRLLPGVGPVMGSRLEAARRRAGGVLAPADLDQVPGLGPVTRARWEALWVAEPDGVR